MEEAAAEAMKNIKTYINIYTISTRGIFI